MNGNQIDDFRGVVGGVTDRGDLLIRACEVSGVEFLSFTVSKKTL